MYQSPFKFDKRLLICENRCNTNCTFWKYRNHIFSAFHADLIRFILKSVQKQSVWATYFREGSECLFWGVNKLLPLFFSFIFQLCILKPAIMLLDGARKAALLLWGWMEIHFHQYSENAWQYTYSSKESLGNNAVCSVVKCTVRYLVMCVHAAVITRNKPNPRPNMHGGSLSR